MPLNEQLRLLAIFHYVVGGMHALFASFGLIHFFVGLMMVAAPETLDAGGNSPPGWFGVLFLVFGGGFVLAGWTLGILTALSGRRIALRKCRKFSIVMGCINCALMPFGTVLGVFTILLLTRDDTRADYGESPGN